MSDATSNELANGERLAKEFITHLENMGGADAVTIPLPGGKDKVRIEVVRGEHEGLPGHPPVGAPSSADLSRALREIEAAFATVLSESSLPPQFAGRIACELDRAAATLNEARAKIDKLAKDNKLLRQIVDDRKKLHDELEGKLEALQQKTDALTMTNRESAEVCAQTVQDLALALGVKLDPCSSGCGRRMSLEPKKTCGSGFPK